MAAAPAKAHLSDQAAYRLVVPEAHDEDAGTQDPLARAPFLVDADLRGVISAVRPLPGAPADADPILPGAGNVYPSPDGRRLAFWLIDPEGHFVPGGTPTVTPGGAASEMALVVMDVDGRHRQILHANPRHDGEPDWLNHFGPVGWKDSSTLVVPGRGPRTAPANGRIGVLYAIDVTTGTRTESLRVDDGADEVVDLESAAAGGGTIVGWGFGLARVAHHDGTTSDLAWPADGSSFQDIAVSPDGDHLAATFHDLSLPFGTPRVRTLIFDHRPDGTWARRDLGLSTAGAWIRWLPYDSFDEAEVLVDRTDGVPAVEQLRVAPDLDDRLVRTYDDAPGPWEVQPAPVPGTGVSDLRLEPVLPPATAGQAWAGTLRVTNVGPDTATGVSLTASLRDGGLTGLSGAGVSCALASGTCTLPDLPAGSSRTIELATTPVATGIDRVRVEVTATQVDWNPADSRLDAQLRTVALSAGNDATGRLITQSDACATPDTPCSEIALVDADGTDRVVLQRASGARSIQLRRADPAAGTFAWTSTDADGTTWIVSRLDGSEVRRFDDPAAGAVIASSLSPDGRTLVWSEPVDDPSGVTSYAVRSQRVDVGGATPRTLTLGSSASLPNQLSFSPDGTRVAYLTQTVGTFAVTARVVDLDGRHDRVVSTYRRDEPEVGYHVRSLPPVWSPDSTQVALAISYGDPRSRARLLLVPVDDPQRARELADAPDDGDGTTLVVDWSPDGERLLAQSSSGALHSYDTSDGARSAGPAVGARFAEPVLYTGLAALPAGGGGGGGTPTGDTTAPVASYRASPGTPLRSGSTLTLSRDVLADDTDTPAQLAVTVAWGDGATTAATGAETTLTHRYTSQGRRTVTVTVSDRAGNTTTALEHTVVVDTTRPRMRIDQPDCGRRNARECRAYRATRRAWSTVRGTVADTGGSGLASAVLTAVQLRGKSWYAFTGSGWERSGSRARAERAARRVPVTIMGARWAVKLPSLSRGTLVLTAAARDEAGNTSATGASAELRR